MLRRYLEQRKELGESELVLDALHVDDVMRLLGAAGSSARSERSASYRDEAMVATSEDADWRTTLREAGVNVDATETAQPEVEPDVVEPPPQSPPISEDMAFKKGIVAPADADAVPAVIQKLDTLDEIARKVQKCTRCPLYETATNGVPGEGDP